MEKIKTDHNSGEESEDPPPNSESPSNPPVIPPPEAMNLDQVVPAEGADSIASPTEPTPPSSASVSPDDESPPGPTSPEIPEIPGSSAYVGFRTMGEIIQRTVYIDNNYVFQGVRFPCSESDGRDMYRTQIARRDKEIAANAQTGVTEQQMSVYRTFADNLFSTAKQDSLPATAQRLEELQSRSGQSTNESGSTRIVYPPPPMDTEESHTTVTPRYREVVVVEEDDSSISTVSTASDSVFLEVDKTRRRSSEPSREEIAALLRSRIDLADDTDSSNSRMSTRSMAGSAPGDLEPGSTVDKATRVFQKVEKIKLDSSSDSWGSFDSRPSPSDLIQTADVGKKKQRDDGNSEMAPTSAGPDESERGEGSLEDVTSLPVDKDDDSDKTDYEKEDSGKNEAFPKDGTTDEKNGAKKYGMEQTETVAATGVPSSTTIGVTECIPPQADDGETSRRKSPETRSSLGKRRSVSGGDGPPVKSHPTSDAASSSRDMVESKTCKRSADGDEASGKRPKVASGDIPPEIEETGRRKRSLKHALEEQSSSSSSSDGIPEIERLV